MHVGNRKDHSLGRALAGQARAEILRFHSKSQTPKANVRNAVPLQGAGKQRQETWEVHELANLMNAVVSNKRDPDYSNRRRRLRLSSAAHECRGTQAPHSHSHTYTHTHIYTLTLIHTYTQIYILTYIHIHIYTYTLTYTHMHAHS